MVALLATLDSNVGARSIASALVSARCDGETLDRLRCLSWQQGAYRAIVLVPAIAVDAAMLALQPGGGGQRAAGENRGVARSSDAVGVL
jgi:hypothetical protein